MIKLYAYAAGLLAVTAALWYLHHAIYDSGYTHGAASKQALWDKDKASIATLAAKQAADVAAKENATATNNAQVIHDLQSQLSATTAGQSLLAKRLRDAQARLATSGSALPEVSGGQGTAGASGGSGGQDLASLCAAVDAEDQRNAIRLNKLIAEITPQLTP